MLLTLLFAALTVLTPKLPSAQAGAMIRTAADYLIPATRDIGTHLRTDRTIIFDHDRSMQAIKPLVDSLIPHDIALTLPAIFMTRDDAIKCDKAKRNCTVAKDAIFLAVDRAEAGPKAGEYRLVTTVEYAEPRKNGTSALKGGTYTLTMGLVGAKYKQWEVLRSVPKIGW